MPQPPSSAVVDLERTIAETRDLSRSFLAPCGFGCGCTRIEHAVGAFGGDKVHGFLAEIDASPNEIAELSLRVANKIAPHVEMAAAHPELVAELENSLQASRNLNLRLSFLELIHHIVGDLPVIAAQQGTPRTSGRFAANAGTFVYIAYDLTDTVIYVGVTDDLFGRMAAHRGTKRWWPEMERLEWEEWPTRDAALRKESTLIRRYRPRFNIVGNPDAKKAKP